MSLNFGGIVPSLFGQENTSRGNQYMEITDPLRLFHDAPAEYGPYDAYWKQTLQDANNLYARQIGKPDAALKQGWTGALAASNDPSNTALLTNAKNYANQVLSGYYLNPETNLAMAQMLQRGLENAHAFDSQAVQSGRYGGGAWGQMKGRNLADLQSNIYGQGLNQMTNMASMAPTIYGSQYLPYQTQMDIGNQREARPWNLLGKRTSFLGQVTANNQPYYQQNPIMGGIGTVLSAIGAIKGMGGGGNSGAQNGMPQYNQQPTYNSGYYNNNNNWQLPSYGY